MPAERRAWDRISLQDVASEIRYGHTAVASAAQVGPKFVRITDILGGRIGWDQVPYCEFSGDREKLGIRAGDILVARIGASAGAASRVDRDEDAVFASYLIRIRIEPTIAENEFVGYVLRSPYWRGYVAATSGGSAQPQFNAPLIRRFSFDLPGLAEQRAIAAVLSALDDKIESNRQLADAVDDVCLMAFEDAERGAIETFALEDLVAFNQLSWSSRRHPAEMDYVDISSLEPRRITTIQRVCWSDAPSRARRIVRSGDTIISTVRPERRALAFVDAASDELTASTGFAVLTPTSVSPTYAYFAATSERATSFFAGAATGSAYPAVRVDAMKTLAVRVPADRGEQFEELARPLLSMARSALAEALTVAAVRDTLLPKLVSGQIRVPFSDDVEEQIGAVTEALA